MADHLNDLFCILFLIITLFIFLYILYYQDTNTNTNTSSHLTNQPLPLKHNAQINAQIVSIIKICKANATKKLKGKLKENFDIDNTLILENDANNYNENLNSLLAEVNNAYYGDYGVLKKLETTLKNANSTRKAELQRIINYLTNIYMSVYLDKLYKKNAEMYKVYLKYTDPTKNKYYSQYLTR